MQTFRQTFLKHPSKSEIRKYASLKLHFERKQLRSAIGIPHFSSHRQKRMVLARRANGCAPKMEQAVYKGYMALPSSIRDDFTRLWQKDITKGRNQIPVTMIVVDLKIA